ncbi:chromate transporter [Ruficoccus sp. ZRK36]|uniref:chromate transporter n=1 Tax=Ruficoccus sp. ZRK36 TaxID=2866311 RepID=UPI001C737475|nr:chromate transporter [Ruficoccus sp. ZRK36]QYY34694.1 chromate transporter [Ruficoccus sp. ZRK36]
MKNDLVHLANVFAVLSLSAIGGGSAVLPDMQHQAVAVNHWVTPQAFGIIYSLGQMAPGPNLSLVGLIGLKAAGPLGIVVALLAFYTPSSFLTYGASVVWDYFKDNPWRAAVQKGLAPVTIGLMLGGVYSIGKTSTFNLRETLEHNAVTIGITLAVCAILFLRKINPALLILIAGGIGWFLLRH